MDIEYDPTEKELRELKENLEKQHGREFTDEEVRDAFWDLRRFAHIMYEVFSEDMRRKEMLKENPKGFHLEEGGTCQICSNYAPKENSWYDKNGVKCMPCQRALNEKIIPPSVIEKKETWYSKHDLERYFNIKGSDLTKYIKQGILKDRVVKGETKKIHCQLFLMKDNKGVLPPKHLLKSRTVTVTHNGKEYLADEEWYEYGDIKLAKRLVKYRIIIECLQDTLQKPITGGRLLVPKNGVSPLFTRNDS